MKFLNNRGVTVIELLLVLAVSSIVLLSLSRLMVFLVRTQEYTYSLNRLINEGGIITNVIVHEVDDVKPDAINKISDTSYEFIGSTESKTISIQDNLDGTFNILIDGTAIYHSTRMVYADIHPVVCDSCPYVPGDDNSYKLYLIEYHLEADTGLVEGGVRKKEFITSLAVFRGF